jgi:hypothetical protein
MDYPPACLGYRGDRLGQFPRGGRRIVRLRGLGRDIDEDQVGALSRELDRVLPPEGGHPDIMI